MNIRLCMLCRHVASIKFSQAYNYFLPIYRNEENLFCIFCFIFLWDHNGKKILKKGKKRHSHYEKTVKYVWEALNFITVWQLFFFSSFHLKSLQFMSSEDDISFFPTILQPRRNLVPLPPAPQSGQLWGTMAWAIHTERGAQMSSRGNDGNKNKERNNKSGAGVMGYLG